MAYATPVGAGAPTARRPKRPFLPAAQWTPAPVIRKRSSRWILGGCVLLAYVVQFGIGILNAVAVFVIRQKGTLGVPRESTAAYLFDVFVLGGVTFLLSITVVLVYRRRAHWTWRDLGVARLPRDAAGRRMWWRAAMVFLAALAAGFLVLGLLSSLHGSGGYPQVDTPASTQLLAVVPTAVMAGVGEELVVVAFLVVALERLGARPWLIYTIAVVARLAYHVYYGPAVVGLLIWALASVWVFRRTRVIVPSVVVHTLWDVNAGLASIDATAVLAGLGALVALGCLVVTGIVHLATRRRPEPPQTAPPWGGGPYPSPVQPGWGPPPVPLALPPPGWYPDPLDPRVRRYWDGRSWTFHVAPYPAPPT